jgi:superfamily II DNA or RNA helicase
MPITLDLHGVKIKSTGDFNEEELEQACNQSYVLDDIINTYKQHDKGYKAICFAINIKHAESLQKAFNDAGITCGIVHSKMKKQHADYWLNEHKKGNIRMLVNVGVLTRGYDDINIIDILVCRPTMSERLYKQIIGRAARIDKDGFNFFRHFDYAGNTERFGLWSDENIYSLDERPKREFEFDPIVCPKCFCTIYEKSRSCSECGFSLIEQLEAHERKIIEKQRTQELIEYKNTTVIEELDKLFNGLGLKFYNNKLLPLKPKKISIEAFNNEVKKITKYCAKMNYKPFFIFYKTKDKFTGVKQDAKNV